jgi:glycolate oxidase FAD binding subunit
VLGELTFKVFPAPPAYATLTMDYPTIAAAVEAMAALRLGAFDLLSLDLIPAAPGHAGAALHLRIGGPHAGLPERIEHLRRRLGGGTLLEEAADAAAWQQAAEFGWVPAGMALVKTPLTPHHLLPLDQRLAAAGAHRRYVAGASLAWIAWPGAADDLSGLLASAGLSGLMLRGTAAHPLIGARQDALLRSRIVAALDPRQRFLPYE